MSDKFYLATFIKSNGLLFDGYDISLGIRGELFTSSLDIRIGIIWVCTLIHG